MRAMRLLKIASVVGAAHLVLFGFIFFKPPLKYFAVVGLSTIIVWPAILAFSRRRPWAGIAVGLIVQMVGQQMAYQAWVNPAEGVWWPLGQFLGLQYVVVLRLMGPE